jgi:hypothetical protein
VVARQLLSSKSIWSKYSVDSQRSSSMRTLFLSEQSNFNSSKRSGSVKWAR